MKPSQGQVITALLFRRCNLAYHGLALLYTFLILSPVARGAVPRSETAALLEFQNAVANPGAVNWPGIDTSSDPCDDRWPQVTCQYDSVSQQEHVSALLLHEVGLGGSLPTALASLQGLKALYLGGNGFTGAVPREYGRLSQLQQLGLNNNAFSSIPNDFFANMTQLQKVFLTSNSFGGQALPDISPLASSLQVRRNLVGAHLTAQMESPSSN